MDYRRPCKEEQAITRKEYYSMTTELKGEENTLNDNKKQNAEQRHNKVKKDFF
jgi:hypothetical protein